MKKWVVRGAMGLAALGVVYASLVITPFGSRSVIWSVGGVSYEERQPGLSFVVPFVQRAYLVDVREQRFVTTDAEGKANAFVQTTDLQEISVRASVVFRVDPAQAAELYDEVGPEFSLRVVQPILYDAIKETGGQRVSLSFAAELAAIAEEVSAIITPQLAERGIEVVTVAVEDAVFDPDFILSVKEKVIADQEAEEQKRLVEAERAKKEQVLLQAEAQRQRAIELGLSPEQYLNLLWIEKWGGVLPNTILSEDAGVILNGAIQEPS